MMRVCLIDMILASTREKPIIITSTLTSPAWQPRARNYVEGIEELSKTSRSSATATDLSSGLI